MEREQACGRIDRSTIRVDEADKVRLIPEVDQGVEDCILSRMGDRWSNPVIDFCPGYRYWEMDESRKMSRPVNSCGHQQRAFDFYWTCRTALAGGITLGIGTNSVMGPGVFGTDLFMSGETPHEGRYGVFKTSAHMRMDAQDIYPFVDKIFQCVMSNHVIEHLDRPWFAVAEMLRVVEVGGYVCLITPDMAYNDRPVAGKKNSGIDPTHKYEFAADQFFEELHDRLEIFPSFKVTEFNTLCNDFSFNVVLQRIG